MKEPCLSCPERERDFGGCRCQAYMLTGDPANADPVCGLSPFHDKVIQAHQQSQRAAVSVKPLVFRDARNPRALTV